ncbi:MAG TPA: alkaline phosphatase family protein [Stellaceae bacterium]|nr:alkaline phosphatase family protein [Stellaceae bacterium]
MRFAAIALISALVVAAGGPSAAAASTMVPPYDHIVVVIEENHRYDEIIGKAAASYINFLASSGALLTNDHAITHPSEPNYFAIYAGSTFGITDDSPHSVPDPSLYTVLHKSGLTFKGYVDPGATDSNHNPWESFPEGMSVERNFIKDFPHNNFSLLPKVSFVIPNLNHDMHDASVAEGDKWLRRRLGAYAGWAPANNSLLIVTFDENDGAPGNHIATVLDGAHIAPGTVDGTYYTHYNLLSTILAAANLMGPRHATTAAHFAVFQP